MVLPVVLPCSPGLNVASLVSPAGHAGGRAPSVPLVVSFDASRGQCHQGLEKWMAEYGAWEIHFFSLSFSSFQLILAIVRWVIVIWTLCQKSSWQVRGFPSPMAMMILEGKGVLILAWYPILSDYTHLFCEFAICVAERFPNREDFPPKTPNIGGIFEALLRWNFASLVWQGVPVLPGLCLCMVWNSPPFNDIQRMRPS